MFTVGPAFWRQGGDQYFANVILLMHFDGNYTDFSPLGQAFTNTGLTTTSTNAKFVQSADVNGSNSTTNSNILLADATRSEYDIHNSDVTMECFIRVNSAITDGNAKFIVTAAPSSGSTDGRHAFSVQKATSGDTVLRYDFDGSGATTEFVSAYITTSVWTHVAVTRVGTTTRFFIDGVLVRTIALSGIGTAASNKRIAVGNSWGQTQAGDISLDEVRVTKGVARYTATFTVPAAAYPNS